MNARKTFLGLAGVALIAAAGLFASACGSSPNNPSPGSGSSGGGTGASSGGSGATSGATAGMGTGATSGATAGASGTSSGATADGGPDATMENPTDAGAPDSGDAGTACNPAAIYPADACAPCAAAPNLLNACSAFNVTCVKFDNSVVPDAHF